MGPAICTCSPVTMNRVALNDGFVSLQTRNDFDRSAKVVACHYRHPTSLPVLDNGDVQAFLRNRRVSTGTMYVVAFSRHFEMDFRISARKQLPYGLFTSTSTSSVRVV